MEMNELAEEIFKQAISHQLDDIHLLPIGEEYVFYLRDVNGLKELRKVSTKIAEQFISYLKYPSWDGCWGEKTTSKWVTDF